MSAHTPGPWKWEAGDGYGSRIEAEDGRGRVLIATINADEGLVTDPTLREACANAVLIAEAPAMMELIGDIGRWFDIALSLGQISRGTANRDSDLVTQIRAILSRIEEGRS